MSVLSIRISEGLSLDLLPQFCLLFLFLLQVRHLIGVVETSHLLPLLLIFVLLESEEIFVVSAKTFVLWSQSDCFLEVLFCFGELFQLLLSERHSVVGFGTFSAIGEGCLSVLDALRVHLFLEEAKSAVQEQDVQDFISSFELVL